MVVDRATPEWQRLAKVTAGLLALVLVGVILSWAQAVLIPLALALLLSFLLNPMVRRMDRAGFGRVPPVILTVTLVSLLLGGVLWLFIAQINSLAYDLPSYRKNISEKIALLQKADEGGALQKIQETLAGVSRDLNESPEEQGLRMGAGATASEPVPVTIVAPMGPTRILNDLATFVAGIAPALEVLATAGLTIILLIFMLIQYEDLRNRLVSFSNVGALSTTTKAFDDAAHRISRYLLMQLIINGTYGIAVFAGLMLIGVPYAFLWGLFAAVFRYIPYVGPWMAALLPLGVSLISSPGWTQVWLVAGLFVLLELISNNLMEPWLYGHGVGISMIALILSAAFWTLIWGPIGLVLATPLTVCLAVAGKYVPALRFLDRLLGESPDLEPHVIFLQRLLARDVVEAETVARAYQHEHFETVYDELLIPALVLIRRERSEGAMSSEDERFVSKATADIVGDLPAAKESASCDKEAVARKRAAASAIGAHSALPNGEQNRMLVIGCPAHHESDELSLLMLQHVLEADGIAMQIISTRMLPTDLVDKVRRERPSAVVISVMPPSGFEQARFLCRRIHKHCEEIPVIVGAWNYQGNLDRLIVRFRSAGAHYVTTTLLGARSHLRSLSPSGHGLAAPQRTAKSGASTKTDASTKPNASESSTGRAAAESPELPAPTAEAGRGS